MPRTSPFPILLSASETAELRRRATKYTSPYFQVQRAKIILMAAEGLENSEIAARLNTRRDVVSEWRKRFFLGRLTGFRRTLSSGSSPDFFPLIWSFRSRLGPANSRPRMTCRCLAGVLRIWRERCVSQAWWLPSAAARFGAGCMRTPFAPGTTVAGSSHAIPTLLKKLAAYWICMPANGKASLCKMMSS